MKSIRSTLSDLRSAFDVGGIPALRDAVLAARRESLRFRILARTVNLLVPIHALLDVIADADRDVGQLGVYAGTRALLGRLPAPLRIDLPDRNLEVLRDKPFVVFGRHGSALTPLIVAAAVGRDDLKMVSASYVARMGPHLAQMTFPVRLPTPSLADAGRGGILPRLIGWIAARLEPPIDRQAAQEANAQSLRRAADHVRQGGALLIAPDGRDPRERWRRGVGRLVQQLADGDCWLVPYRIWASHTALFQFLSRNPLLRRIGERRYRRHPARIALGTPLAVADVIAQAGDDAQKITEFLEAHYVGLGF